MRWLDRLPLGILVALVLLGVRLWRQFGSR
ncbi:hypothetical protein M2244_002080 [Rhodoferax antarcticus]|nr:hypothetical protein [Rhodoferax antarcticus]